ncbi:MAG: 3-hydroxyacyl-CoA dehydrogenase family protein [Acidobacteriota bacterium]
MFTVSTVGVVGCGLMGSGIAQVSAMAGYATIVREVSDDLIAKGFGRIDESLQKLVRKESMTAEEKERARARLTGTVDLESLKGCDLVIEAVTEDFETKRAIFETLDQVCKAETVFASNTSSLSITELMVTTNRAQRFVGLHFFNPVPVMQLVEVVRTVSTDPEVFDTVVQFSRSLGKKPVLCEDRSGFIVNRLLIPYLMDAVRALEEGAGSMEDIDLAMKLGCGHPMGPFALMDFIGLDTVYHIANILFDEFRETRFAPPPLLKRMVLAGRLGLKSGQGFHSY